MTAFEWNKRYKPGQRVIVVMDDGEERETRTKSIAWNLGGGHPVIKVEGISGGYALHRVRAVKRED